MIKTLHPLTLFCYFVSVITVSVATLNPAILGVGFVGAALFLALEKRKTALKQIAFSVILVVIIAVTNPIFSHNGATILFFIDDNRVTLEALYYGASSGLMISSVILWFSCFSALFDSERIIYLTGRAFPKLGLVLSMILGLVPRLLRDFKSINAALKTIEKRRLRRYLGAFSALITRSMEDAIVTADSMRARGYGQKGRTFYSRFRFTALDFSLIIVFAALLALSLVFTSDVNFYPNFSLTITPAGFAAFVILSLLPAVIKLKEGIGWSFSLSKI